MSLSALLLGSKPDTELDSLFKVQVPVVAPVATKTRQKRKIQSNGDDAVETSPKKRPKPDLQKEKALTSPSRAAKTGKPNSIDKPSRKEKKKERKVREHDFINEDDSDDNSDLENAYPSKLASSSKVIDQHSDEDLVHESFSKTTKQKVKSSSTLKRVSEDEMPDVRNRRTIFVGNLPLGVLSKKLFKRQLQRHILSFVPTAKIESIRFRSIPFQVPTSKLPEPDGDQKLSSKQRESKIHSKERASLWRSKRGDKDEESVKADEKKYLTPAQKKKIAYIHQEFHSTADVVNAYIVFSHPLDTAERPANLPPPPPIMDPYQAAVQAAVKANGSIFMERIIRVDLVGKTDDTVIDPNNAEEIPVIQVSDPRLSIFVGNLDFASKEEDLRVFFEALMCTERGHPREDVIKTDGEVGDATKISPTWVTRVRIIRDKDTQLGKGFAYVQFADWECVAEVLAMEESKLKFAKRKLRVQRCKIIPGGAKHTTPNSKHSSASHAKSGNVTQPKSPVVIPKGDPSLGEKLASLSKEERKKRKSADPDRLARRLAKKKARMAMAPSVGNPVKRDRKRVRSKPNKS